MTELVVRLKIDCWSVERHQLFIQSVMYECSGSSEFCELLATLADGLRISRVSNLCSVSALALYLYNFVSTYEDEVNIMWKSDLSIGKVIYFVMRYLTLAFVVFVNSVLFVPHVTSELCLHWIRFHWIVGFILDAITEVPVFLRIYAFYNRKPTVSIFSLSCIVATGGSMLVITSLVLRNEGARAINFSPGVHVCIPTHVNPAYKMFWIPLMANDAILLTLLLTKWVSIHRSCVTPSFLVNAVVKESVVYFLGSFPFFLWNHIMFNLPVEYSEIGVGLGVCMSSIMTQRFITNLKKFRYGPQETVSSTYAVDFVARTQETVVAEESEMQLDRLGAAKAEVTSREGENV